MGFIVLFWRTLMGQMHQSGEFSHEEGLHLLGTELGVNIQMAFESCNMFRSTSIVFVLLRP